MSFRGFRILILLVLLVSAGGITFWERWSVARWSSPLEVVIYPVNGDGSDTVQRYVDGLEQSRFQEIAAFIEKRGGGYLMKSMPSVAVELGREIQVLPPMPPEGRRSVLESMKWSLEMRYFAFRSTPFFDSFGKIRLFVVYHQGEEGKALQHSLGLQKGLVGVVHAYGRTGQEPQNNVVIAHELLHALGATDKYDAHGLPVYPEGFGVPDDAPHYPQRVAEIMAGRVAVSPTTATIPESLAACVVGYRTAHEINW